MKKKNKNSKWLNRIITILLLTLIILLLLSQYEFNNKVITFNTYQNQINQQTQSTLDALNHELEGIKQQNKLLQAFILEKEKLPAKPSNIELPHDFEENNTQPAPKVSNVPIWATVGTIIMSGVRMVSSLFGFVPCL